MYEEKFGMNVLVIDVGTSSMRGILFEHQGKCLTEKQEFYQATLSGKQLGGTESGGLGKCIVQHFETVRSRS